MHYATLAVPRYTSYPTAVDFVSISDEMRIHWLQGLELDQTVSLYLHIPYCSNLCHYCGCFTKAVRRKDIIDTYADIIEQDIRLQASYLKGKPRVIHLHWGGGTPSLLSRKSFKKIMQALHETFLFDAAAEHAIELDPRTVRQELVSCLAEIGVNRASLGVQDINPEVQKLIGRIQPVTDVRSAIRNLHAVGIERVNFDLIYGLPLQTQQSLRQTCETVAAFQPDRLACYGYAHLPKRRSNQRLIDVSLLPNAFERFKQIEVVADSLCRFGYEAIGIDHFARPSDPITIAMHEKKLRRNFQGYTDDDSRVLIGFGASSISEFSQGYVQTVADINQYRKAIAVGRLATVRGIIMNDDDKVRATLIGDLMCQFKVDLSRYGGKTLFAVELERLKTIIADGIAHEVNGIISITEVGRPFVRVVAALFDRYRNHNIAQFSAAV